MALGSDTLRQSSVQALGGTFFNKSINQSLRFSEDDSPYLTFTPSSSTPGTWTMSVWVKRNRVSTGSQYIIGSGAVNQRGGIGFAVNTHQDRLFIGGFNSSGANAYLWSNMQFRDTASWYHIVVKASGYNLASFIENVNVYVNGKEIEMIESIYNSPTDADRINDTQAKRIGELTPDGGSHFDGYMAEFHWIDGTAYGPEFFGEDKNGVWIPKEVTGVTYGAAGYHLDFADSSDIGNNANTTDGTNDWTPSGVVATDVVPESPSNKWCTWNTNDKYNYNAPGRGGLRALTSGNNGTQRATFEISSGKWYWEVRNGTAGSGTLARLVGISKVESAVSTNPYQSAANYQYYSYDGSKYNNNTGASYGDSFQADGDIIGVAFDADNGAIWFSKNGTWQNSATASEIAAGTTSNAAYTSLSGVFSPFVGKTGGTSSNDPHDANFGQDPSFANTLTGGDVGTAVGGGGTWKYAPPAGFKALNAINLSEPDSVSSPRNDSIENSFFYTILYEGNGRGQRVGQFLPLSEVKTVNNAIRFEDGDTPTLTRTSSSASSSDKQFTFSCWFKIGDLSGAYRTLLGTAEGGDREYIGLMDTNEFIYQVNNSTNLISNRKFLDTSSWHHVVVAVNINESTASDRQKIYINGEQITSFSSANYYGSSDTVNFMKSGVQTRVGGLSSSYNNPWDGYMADVHFVDGSTLTPTSFGQTDPSTEKWIPKTYSGTHGTNGFHLEFLNNTVGADSDGSNDFTPANLATANTVTDTPTRNYMTLGGRKGTVTMSEGNLRAVAGADYQAVFGSMPLPDIGKYYYEVYIETPGGGNVQDSQIMIQGEDTEVTGSSPYPQGANPRIGYFGSGLIGGSREDTAYTLQSGLTAHTAGAIFGVAVNMDDKEVSFYRNGSQVGSTHGFQTLGQKMFVRYVGATNRGNSYNFGQDPTFSGQLTGGDVGTATDGTGGVFKYTPPAGYKALHTDNFPQSSQGIARRKTPVLTWIKNRDSTDSHMLFDQVRGATKVIHSDPDTHQVETTEVNTLQKFVPGGFQIGNDVQVNTTSESYVAWNWCMHDEIVNAGPQTMSPAGTIAATGLADRRLGFSVVKFTGTGANGTVGHGLSQAPEMIMVASLEDTSNWLVYHKFSDGTDGRQFLNLNKTIASFDNGPGSYFQDTPPSSTVISVNGSTYNSSSNDFVYYCFHSVPGFSKYNVYSGNADADGTFVHCGFKPAFVMMKRLGSGGWHVFDNQRSPINAENDIRIELDNSDAENNGGSNNLYIDFVSNGFKLRTTFDNMNGSSDYIYWAMAEQPFKFANAR